MCMEEGGTDKARQKERGLEKQILDFIHHCNKNSEEFPCLSRNHTRGDLVTFILNLSKRRALFVIHEGSCLEDLNMPVVPTSDSQRMIADAQKRIDLSYTPEYSWRHDW